MVNQLNCLKAGGLVLGIIGTIVAVINVIYAIAIYESFAAVDHNFVLAALIGEAPDHIIRLTYVTISICDLFASALLIAGILLVSKANNCSIISKQQIAAYRRTKQTKRNKKAKQNQNTI